MTPCTSLSEDLRLDAAELAADAMSALYDLVRADVVPVLASEFLIPESELGDALALLQPGLGGLVAHYPAKEIVDRQRASLYNALASLDRAPAALLMAQLRRQSGIMPQERAMGDYIARFAVHKNLRGTGTADRLMRLFAAGRPVISLHVRKDNPRAIRFYYRHGFKECGKSEEFLLMMRGRAAL